MRQFRPPRGRMCERRAPYRAANSALSSALHGTALGMTVPPIVVLNRIESVDDAAAELGDLAAMLVGGVWI